LTLARQGQAVGDTEPVELERVVQRAWSHVSTVEADLVIDDELPVIDADEERLIQMFENLFRNSVEHGGEDVEIHIGIPDDGDGFYIEDNGEGISDEERDKVFEHGYTTHEAGTGFGLSIVKRIVEAHGGEIRVVEGSMGGARFEVSGIHTPEIP
ncbi:MAG: HAMP domain-containing sensor histidine kinase, partial [Halobacteria archaeon]|nr:HAMP domain-containing sensor histidine kinase [Halobacteria archaeon]